MLLSLREVWLVLACVALAHLYLHRRAVRRACARIRRSSQSRPPGRLPNELFTEVFLALDGHKPTLVALSLCLRHMRALAEPVLFRTLAATIHVGTSKHELDRSPVLALLAQTPRPLAHVTAVELALESKYSFHPCSDPLLLPPLPVFDNAPSLALLYNSHNIWCTRTRWIELFTALGPSFPGLVELDLRRAGFTCFNTPRQVLPAPIPVQIYREALPTLRRLISLYPPGAQGFAVGEL